VRRSPSPLAAQVGVFVSTLGGLLHASHPLFEQRPLALWALHQGYHTVQVGALCARRAGGGGGGGTDNDTPPRRMCAGRRDRRVRGIPGGRGFAQVTDALQCCGADWQAWFTVWLCAASCCHGSPPVSRVRLVDD
jgi:hypothetical protein